MRDERGTLALTSHLIQPVMKEIIRPIEVSPALTSTGVGKFGTKQLSDLQTAIVVGVKTAEEVWEDKKFGISDAFSALRLAKPLEEAADGIDETDDEYLDLYDEEIADLEAQLTELCRKHQLSPKQTAVAIRVQRINLNVGALVREVRTPAEQYD